MWWNVLCVRRLSQDSSVEQLMEKCLLIASSFLCVLSLADLDDPVVTVHQSIGEAKEQFYYERTVFLRCVANSNPPVRYSWHRGREVLTQGSDKGVEIYEPFFTQVRQRQHDMDKRIKSEGRADAKKDVLFHQGNTYDCYKWNLVVEECVLVLYVALLRRHAPFALPSAHYKDRTNRLIQPLWNNHYKLFESIAKDVFIRI